MQIRNAILGLALPALLSIAGCNDASVVGVEPLKAPNAPAERATIYKRAANPRVRYLFYDTEFRLEYGSERPYVGSLTRTESTIALDFAPGGVWCPEVWCKTFLATAVVRADTLFVDYDRASAWILCNDMMDTEACDSRRGVFVRAQ